MRLIASITFAAAAALTLALASPALADPEGTFKVTGTNPGGQGEYSGTVTIAEVGENVYAVNWQIGSSAAVGTAVGDEDFLSVGYKSGDNFGVALFVREGSDWSGVWTYGGGKEIGTETWTPQ